MKGGGWELPSLSRSVSLPSAWDGWLARARTPAGTPPALNGHYCDVQESCRGTNDADMIEDGGGGGDDGDGDDSLAGLESC